MTIEEVTAAVNAAPFPAVAEGDIVYFEGFWFRRNASAWEPLDPQPDPPQA